MSFGTKIRSLREDKGFSIKTLARSVNVDYTYLSKIENDKSIPSEDFIERLASIFGCDVEELKVSAGKIPGDIRDIIKENPREVVEYLRKAFGRQ